MASGLCEPLWPMWFSVYASQCPPLFAVAAVETACNAPSDAQHSIRVVGQTLRVHSSELPVRDFHPERSDKLRLPHQRQGQRPECRQPNNLYSSTNFAAALGSAGPACWAVYVALQGFTTLFTKFSFSTKTPDPFLLLCTVCISL